MARARKDPSHADTAVRDRAPDGPWRRCPVDAEIGIPPVLEQVERPRAKRVAGAAGLYVIVVLELGIGLGLTFDHLVRGAPRGPLFLDVDGGGAGELQP